MKKSNIPISLFLAAILLHSCHYSDTNNASQVSEFDIPHFIQNEINELKTKNPTVNKTVIKDGATETQNLKISKWENELSHFANIDLNKNAYNGNFKKDSVNNEVSYAFSKGETDKLLVKIIYKENKPYSLEIQKENSNLLFSNKEILQYTKGIAYSINKKQHVKGIGDNLYQIIGKF